MNKSSELFNFFSQKNEGKEPYKGMLTFTDRTISFSGTTILSKNVAKFEQYGFRFKYRLHTIHLIVFAILMIICFLAGSYMQFAGYALLVIVLYGIWERIRPRQYGLTIELNSGARHYFINKDKNGIDYLFKVITEAIQNELPMQFNAKFENSRVVIGNSHGPISMGDNTHHHNYSETNEK